MKVVGDMQRRRIVAVMHFHEVEKRIDRRSQEVSTGMSQLGYMTYIRSAGIGRCSSYANTLDDPGSCTLWCARRLFEWKFVSALAAVRVAACVVCWNLAMIACLWSWRA